MSARDKLSDSETIVGLGESLFDVYPDHRVLGGAPLNVAVMAHQLLVPTDGRGAVVSRIGWDEDGDAIIRELAARRMTTSYLQPDDQHPTGSVQVTVCDGEPEYEIVGNSAWDFIEVTDQSRKLASRCGAVCFGTLAQRSESSRNAIREFLTAASRAIRLFDVNLRQSYYSAALIVDSLKMATWAKMNRQELVTIAELLDLKPRGGETDSTIGLLRALLSQFPLDGVALTLGRRGLVIQTRLGLFDAKPISISPAENADFVGAGDAAAAGLLVGLLRDWPMNRVAALANEMGAFVASQCGATPTLPERILRLCRDDISRHPSDALNC